MRISDWSSDVCSSDLSNTRVAAAEGRATCPLPPAHAPPRMLVSRTRPAAEAVHVAERLGAELIAMGSAGAKAMAVVRGEADIYLHTGGQYEWDNCAAAAVAAAAGLRSEEHTSELQSLMRLSYAVFCLKNK